MAAGAFQSFCTFNSHESFSPDRFKLRDSAQQKTLLTSNDYPKKPKPLAELDKREAALKISSYVDLGSMENALRVFESVAEPDTYLWNLMIKGYANIGSYEVALEFYHQMLFMGVGEDNFTFPFVIKACAGLFCLEEGGKVHAKLIKVGLDSDIFICNSLISMYAKIGCVEFAEKVLYEMPVRDSVSWNAMINGYVYSENGWKSLACFREMMAVGVMPDRFSLIGALGACSLDCNEKKAKEIHCHAIKYGLESDLMVLTSLVDMYGKCENMHLAERLFNGTRHRSVVVWNVLIDGYVLNDQPREAFACLIKMQEDDNLNPDLITLVNLLPACGQAESLLLVKSIHGFSFRRRFVPHLVLETTLLDVYGKHGEIKLAYKLFEGMTEKSLVSWNAMIAAYVENGWNMEAIELFYDLRKGLLEPDEVTVSSIVPAYTEIGLLRQSKQIHGCVVKFGYGVNTFISNSITYMYAKCGDLESAQRIFDGMMVKDVVSWNTILMGFGIHGCGEAALGLFAKMHEMGVEPNAVTFVSILSSCSISGLVDEGQKHFKSMKEDYGIEPQIEHYGCMVDLLGRTGNLESALNFINRMPLTPTARIWGSLLTASRKHSNIELAEFVVEQISTLENDNTGCYVLLSNMYAEANRWVDVKRVRSLMKKEGLEKTVGCSTVELNSKTCSFINGDRSHIETDTIYDTIEILSQLLGEPIYIPCLKFRPLDVVKRKANLPSTHSVRLALSYGLISSTVGTPILIKKNIRICDECHNAAKSISKITRREIIVGDSGIYHHFKDGSCCCSDYW